MMFESWRRLQTARENNQRKKSNKTEEEAAAGIDS
jgi:hypothetical protein